MKKGKGEFSGSEIYEQLREIAKIDINDFFHFEISPPVKDLENPVYGGTRFAVKATIDDRIFVNYKIDVVSDFFPEAINSIQMHDWQIFSRVRFTYSGSTNLDS